VTIQPQREELGVRYLVDLDAADIEAAAGALAVEQSIEMPPSAVRHGHVIDETLGRVRSIEPAPGGGFVVELGLAASTVGRNPAQLLSMVFGNVSLLPHVQLLDVELPAGLVGHLGGPRHGIEGLRNLVGATGRALTCTALKPLGLAPSELGSLAHTFALAGIDIIKDDHGIADQVHAPFDDRVAACQAAVTRANELTGLRVRYAPSLVGPPSELARQAEVARSAGVRVVLVAPMAVGLPTFTELVGAFPELVFLGHPAFAGALRIDPAFLLGALFRVLGADAVIYPNYGGRFSYSDRLCARIADRARHPWPGVRRTLPVPAGGMTVERVDELLGFYGPDVMLLIGGGLLTAGDALAERSREFVDTVHAHRFPVAAVEDVA
jgi:ribulose-bisphosphate carboxylase large chain